MLLLKLKVLTLLLLWQDPKEGSDDDRLSEIKSALLNITDVFCAPLEAKGADLTSIVLHSTR